MKNFLFLASLMLFLSSCFKGQEVDVIVHNAAIHSMNEGLEVYQAMAIKDGKIIEIGPERKILNQYRAEETIDAQGRDVYPGLIDAHGHILSYAKQKLSVDLVGALSYEELLVRTELYQQKFNRNTIIGRGWDQSLWGGDELPTNKRLNELFPSTPVALYRIDGHALLVNDKMLQKAGITAATKVEGGIIHLDSTNAPTGVLVDNAMELVNSVLPEFDQEEVMLAITEIQQELLQYGITSVHEAGINFKDIALLEKMIDQGILDVELYAMLLTSEENFDFVRKHGVYTHKNLLIRSFKVYGDGALGSRGAFLKKPYADAHNHHGVLTTSIGEMKTIANFCLEHNYQMNTHAIGDSTNRILLELYQNAFSKNPDHRWRIEHAQVIDPTDFKLFAEYGVFPSVQPTHAVSDQRWAESRLGKDRMKGAYAYKTLLDNYGMVALGTDFPVENIDPFMTIHSAILRKNSDGVPGSGFYSSEALTLDECMQGMTKWAAMASFQEDQFGQLVKGMDATFAIFESPIQPKEPYQQNFALYTFIKGKKVYSVE